MTGSDEVGDDFIPARIQQEQAAGHDKREQDSRRRMTPVRNAIETVRGRHKNIGGKIFNM